MGLRLSLKRSCPAHVRLRVQSSTTKQNKIMKGIITRKPIKGKKEENK